MAPRIFFIHTVNGLVETFTKLCQELIPDAEPCHLSDDSLILAVLAAGGLTPAIYRRICSHVVVAEESGANAIQVTCSSVSPCVEVAGHLVGVPVLRIDQAMVERALTGFERIGVIATAPTTLKPTTDLVRRQARLRGLSPALESVLCEGAYDAFLAGDTARHDHIVRDKLRRLRQEADVVLLAQASMARVCKTLDEDEGAAPILSSPRPAIEHLARILNRTRIERT